MLSHDEGLAELAERLYPYLGMDDESEDDKEANTKLPKVVFIYQDRTFEIYDVTYNSDAEQVEVRLERS